MRDFVRILDAYPECALANAHRRRALWVHPGSIFRVRTDSMMEGPGAMGGYPSRTGIEIWGMSITGRAR